MKTLAALKKIPAVFCWISGILLCGIFALMVAEVVMRNGFHSPIVGVSEICIYMNISAMYFGISYTQQLRGHIAVDLVYDRLSERGKRVLDTLVAVICVAIFAIFTVCAWKAFAASFAIREIYLSAIRMPVYVLKFAVALGVTMMLFQLVIDLIEQILKDRTPLAAAEGKEEAE